MINFFCSACSQALETEDFKAGRVVTCPTCKNKVTVPHIIEEATVAQAAPAPQQFDFPEEPARDYAPAYRPRRKSQSSSMGCAILVASMVVFCVGAFAVLSTTGRYGDGSKALLHGVGGLVFLFVCAMAYFVPSVIAFLRGHHQRFAILVMNFFLGWSGLFWIICLIWSFMAVDSREHVHHHYNH